MTRLARTPLRTALRDGVLDLEGDRILRGRARDLERDLRRLERGD